MKPEDRQTFDGFARAHLSHLLRFGFALTGDRDAAADLVQEALARAGSRWSKVSYGPDPFAYVRQTMVNTNISWWRRARREAVVEQVPDSATFDDPARDIAIWDAIRGLPPRQRAVIALRYFEDLSERQTAEILDCSVGNVKSQSARAIDKLRVLLQTERETR